MSENTSAPVAGRSIPPSQLPLRERAALFARLNHARQRQRPSSWQQLAIETGFAQRTLEHFYSGATGLEANADKRPDWVIQNERDGRYFHAQLTATSASRAVVLPDDVPEGFTPPPLCRGLTPSQLPLRDQAALFDELWGARRRRPSPSWQYLAILHGFAPRTLEHFYAAAMKLKNNAGTRSVIEIFCGVLRARRVAVPAGRRSAADPAEPGAHHAGERRRTDRAARSAEDANPAAGTGRSALALDERRAAEAREEQWRRRYDESVARASERAREAEEERRLELEEEQLIDSLRERYGGWDPWWGPVPVESPFDA